MFLNKDFYLEVGVFAKLSIWGCFSTGDLIIWGIDHSLCVTYNIG